MAILELAKYFEYILDFLFQLLNSKLRVKAFKNRRLFKIFHITDIFSLHIY